MCYTDDPVRDAEEHQRTMRPVKAVYPECEYCKETITDEELIDLYDDLGFAVHIECFVQAHKSKTKHFIKYR